MDCHFIPYHYTNALRSDGHSMPKTDSGNALKLF